MPQAVFSSEKAHHKTTMNSLFFATFLCLGALASAYYGGQEDGSWKGEGLAESQDNGQYDYGYGAGAYAAGPVHYAGVYAYGAAPLGADGRVVDTPEVAQAKAAHLAAVSGASKGAYAPLTYAAAPAQYAGVYAHGAAPIGADGRVVDTPEVAQAKSAHLAAVSGASKRAYSPLAYAAAPAYIVGSYGAAPIGADGRVVDTPEVAQAKAAHLAAVSGASKGAYSPLAYAAAPAYIAGSYGAAPIGADGHVVDTPEVAQAKAAHYAAVSGASHGAYGKW